MERAEKSFRWRKCNCSRSSLSSVKLSSRPRVSTRRCIARPARPRGPASIQVASNCLRIFLAWSGFCLANRTEGRGDSLGRGKLPSAASPGARLLFHDSPRACRSPDPAPPRPYSRCVGRRALIDRGFSVILRPQPHSFLFADQLGMAFLLHMSAYKYPSVLPA